MKTWNLYKPYRVTSYIQFLRVQLHSTWWRNTTTYTYRTLWRVSIRTKERSNRHVTSHEDIQGNQFQRWFPQLWRKESRYHPQLWTHLKGFRTVVLLCQHQNVVWPCVMWFGIQFVQWDSWLRRWLYLRESRKPEVRYRCAVVDYLRWCISWSACLMIYLLLREKFTFVIK